MRVHDGPHAWPDVVTRRSQRVQILLKSGVVREAYHFQQPEIGSYWVLSQWGDLAESEVLGWRSDDSEKWVDDRLPPEATH